MTSNVVIIGTWLELEEIWALDQGNTSSSMTLGVIEIRVENGISIEDLVGETLN